MQDRSVDPERPRGANPFDAPDGYSGQGYTAGREIAEGAAAAGPAFRPQVDGRDLPPDTGRRAAIDRATGEVHGSGAGIGGGNPGEDFDSASASGDAYPLTGGEGSDGTPGPLGPQPAQPTPLG
ncbi:hypothetical protein [Sphingomonas sp.]|uniref:hypothetical protein n=1 Tax=Sphingomonas sp. TaxID=28214 RepID=UPI003CC6D39C